MDGVRFSEIFAQMVSPQRQRALCQRHAPIARGGRRLSPEALVQSLIFHQLQPAGTLAAHGTTLHGIAMSDSAYAQRRALLPQALFDELMDAALAPLADAQRQPESFYAGWRLVGIDGTQCSVANTPAIVAALPKAASRRFCAAFAKLRLVVLTELGTHAPLAACAAPAAEASEQVLAAALWAKVPDRSLVIGDRLFGCGKTLGQALTAWAGRDIALLVRVKHNLKPKMVERLADGSALIEVAVRDDAHRVIDRLVLREIRARGVAVNGKRFELRLWTTLTDAARYPALVLAQHYATRWEQELYYRELKLDVRHNPVLAGHTVETALQELAALVLASALIARLRVEAAERGAVAPTRMSFYKLRLATDELWATLALMGPLLSRTQYPLLLERYFELVQRTALLPERRARSCPRVVRQPVTKWPRKLDQPSHTGEVTLELMQD